MCKRLAKANLICLKSSRHSKTSFSGESVPTKNGPPQLRQAVLSGAGNGSRTHLLTLGRSHSTDELYPQSGVPLERLFIISYFAEKCQTVLWEYTVPGSSTTDGKSGWLIASGYPCASKATPICASARRLRMTAESSI